MPCCSHRSAVRRWGVVSHLLRLLFPRYCSVCGARLEPTEEVICATCFLRLPRTHLDGARGNGVERLFWGRLPIVRADAYLYYRVDDDSSSLFHDLKYHNRPRVGRFFGRVMAEHLRSGDFFDGVDAIVPVPLHRHKQQRRGYNQSVAIARGIADVTGLPIDVSAVERCIDTPTQTRLTADERRRNVSGVFRVPHPERVARHHFLLVDDVLTTGATLCACGEALAAVEGVRLSVLTLGLAGRHAFEIRYYEGEGASSPEVTP